MGLTHIHFMLRTGLSRVSLYPGWGYTFFTLLSILSSYRDVLPFQQRVLNVMCSHAFLFLFFSIHVYFCHNKLFKKSLTFLWTESKAQ